MRKRIRRGFETYTEEGQGLQLLVPESCLTGRNWGWEKCLGRKNGVELGTADTALSQIQCFRRVFGRGLIRGCWAGGRFWRMLEIRRVGFEDKRLAEEK